MEEQRKQELNEGTRLTSVEKKKKFNLLRAEDV